MFWSAAALPLDPSAPQAVVPIGLSPSCVLPLPQFIQTLFEKPQANGLTRKYQPAHLVSLQGHPPPPPRFAVRFSHTNLHRLSFPLLLKSCARRVVALRQLLVGGTAPLIPWGKTHVQWVRVGRVSSAHRRCACPLAPAVRHTRSFPHSVPSASCFHARPGLQTFAPWSSPAPPVEGGQGVHTVDRRHRNCW